MLKARYLFRAGPCYRLSNCAERFFLGNDDRTHEDHRVQPTVCRFRVGGGLADAGSVLGNILGLRRSLLFPLVLHQTHSICWTVS